MRARRLLGKGEKTSISDGKGKAWGDQPRTGTILRRKKEKREKVPEKEKVTLPPSLKKRRYNCSTIQDQETTFNDFT